MLEDDIGTCGCVASACHDMFAFRLLVDTGTSSAGFAHRWSACMQLTRPEKSLAKIPDAVERASSTSFEQALLE